MSTESISNTSAMDLPHHHPRYLSNDAVFHLITHNVMPYSPVTNARVAPFVHSAPLALAAAAPAFRVYCEDHFPYRLAGVWWLSHYTVQGVSEEDTKACEAPPVVHAPSQPSPDSHAHSTTLQQSEPRAHAPATPSEVLLSTSSVATDTAEGHGMDGEKALSVSSTDLDDDDNERSEAHTLEVDTAKVMTRSTGTMGLLPTTLMGARIFFYLDRVPPAWISFCTVASQSSSADAIDVYRASHEGTAHRRVGGGLRTESAHRKRLLVTSQLYVICSNAEARLAYSLWWCQRRTAAVRRYSVTRSQQLHSFCEAHHRTTDPVDDRRCTALDVTALMVCGDITFFNSVERLSGYLSSPAYTAHKEEEEAEGEDEEVSLLLEKPLCYVFLHGPVIRAVEQGMYEEQCDEAQATQQVQQTQQKERAAAQGTVTGGSASPTHSTDAKGTAAGYVGGGDGAGDGDGRGSTTPAMEDEHDDKLNNVHALFSEVYGPDGEGGEEEEEDDDAQERNGPGVSRWALRRRRRKSQQGLQELVATSFFTTTRAVHVAHLRLEVDHHIRAGGQPTEEEEEQAATTSPASANAEGSATAASPAWDVGWLAALFPDLRLLSLEGCAPPENRLRTMMSPARVAFTAYPSAVGMGSGPASCVAPGRMVGVEKLRFLQRLMFRGCWLTELPTLIDGDREEQTDGEKEKRCEDADGTHAPPLTVKENTAESSGTTKSKHNSVTSEESHVEPSPSLSSIVATPSAAPPRRGENDSASHRCRALRELSIAHCTGLDDDGLAHLCTAGLTCDALLPPMNATHRVDRSNGVELTVLSLTDMVSVNSLQWMATSLTARRAMHALTQLELSRTRVTSAALEHLPICTPQLRVLRLTQTPVTDVSVLLALTQLETLNLASSDITKAGLAQVHRFPRLRRLYLTRCLLLCVPGVQDVLSLCCPDDQREWARTMSPTASLAVTAVPPSLGGLVSPSQRPRLCRPLCFPRLEVLDLSGNPHCDETVLFPNFRVEQQLVRQSHGFVNGGGWMPRLRQLSLMHTALTELGRLVAFCPRLRTLDASFTKVTSAGLWCNTYVTAGDEAQNADRATTTMLPPLSLDAEEEHEAREESENADKVTNDAASPLSSSSRSLPPPFFPPLSLFSLNLSGSEVTTLLPLRYRPPPTPSPASCTAPSLSGSVQMTSQRTSPSSLSLVQPPHQQQHPVLLCSPYSSQRVKRTGSVRYGFADLRVVQRLVLTDSHITGTGLAEGYADGALAGQLNALFLLRATHLVDVDTATLAPRPPRAPLPVADATRRASRHSTASDAGPWDTRGPLPSDHPLCLVEPFPLSVAEADPTGLRRVLWANRQTLRVLDVSFSPVPLSVFVRPGGAPQSHRATHTNATAYAEDQDAGLGTFPLRDLFHVVFRSPPTTSPPVNDESTAGSTVTQTSVSSVPTPAVTSPNVQSEESVALSREQLTLWYRLLVRRDVLHSVMLTPDVQIGALADTQYHLEPALTSFTAEGTPIASFLDELIVKLREQCRPIATLLHAAPFVKGRANQKLAEAEFEKVLARLTVANAESAPCPQHQPSSVEPFTSSPPPSAAAGGAPSAPFNARALVRTLFDVLWGPQCVVDF